MDVGFAALAALRLMEDGRRHESSGDEVAVGVRIVVRQGLEQIVEQRRVLLRDVLQSLAVRQVGRKSLV